MFRLGKKLQQGDTLEMNEGVLQHCDARALGRTILACFLSCSRLTLIEGPWC